MDYKSKLKDPRWQKKRLEIMSRDNFKCTLCGNSKAELVHHIYYEKGLNPWEYDDECYVTLCCECHPVAHREIKKISSIIALSVLLNKKTFIDVQNCLKAGRIL